MKINENKLAKDVSAKEGGVIDLPIAQIKETQKALLDDLANNYPMSAVVELVERHKN